MTDFDLIDGPTYERRGLSISTDGAWRRDRRLRTLRAQWGVYYHGRLLHGGLHRDEVDVVLDWYASNELRDSVPASDPRWQLLSTPGKQPSPSTDHRRKAGVS